MRAAGKRVDSGIGRNLDAAPPGAGHSPPGRRKRRFMRLIGVKSNRWQMRRAMGLPGSSARKRRPSLPACRVLEDDSCPGATGCLQPPRPGADTASRGPHSDNSNNVAMSLNGIDADYTKYVDNNICDNNEANNVYSISNINNIG